MGVFDDLRCEMPLPETALPLPKGGDTIFQTKDTPDQYLTLYTITADGHLMWRPYKVEARPEEEREKRGPMRRVESAPERIEFHGTIDFYEYQAQDESQDGRSHWWEFRAKFTDGVCVEISLVEHR